jgi:hypothetical protein
MKFSTKPIYQQLLRNGRVQVPLAEIACPREGGAPPDADFLPVVKLFTPDAGCTWLLSELDPEDSDIAGSYSADRIGMGLRVRKPFSFEGALWTCVGTGPYGDGLWYAEAYRLVHPAAFKGTPVTHREKTADGDAARADPNGFYHGMRVRHAGQDFVLCGPPVILVPGETEQRELF